MLRLLLQAGQVVWSASCGTITPAGDYTAPAAVPSGGQCRITATAVGATGSGSSLVTIAGGAIELSLGVPFGPFALWQGVALVAGPAPFTTSQNYTDPASVVQLIAAARAQQQHLVLALFGGPKSDFQTAGAFDLAKWKARADRFNTAAIRSAIAAGVADETVIGSSLLDEPEHKDWGPGLSKPVLDQMAVYLRGILPTLPIGANFGLGFLGWRPTERFTQLDYLTTQYSWVLFKGDVVRWRDSVQSLARRDGLGVAFSLNLLDGGVQDTDGTIDCPWSAPGTFGTNCWMTPDQVRSWAELVGPSGCYLLLWRFDAAFMGRAVNQQALRDVAGTLATVARRRCARS